jgi:RNA polymerase sigma-70 factor (ECF subfamily)
LVTAQPLCAAFARGFGAAPSASTVTCDEPPGPAHGLEQVLREIVDAAQASWPTLLQPSDRFVRYLAERAAAVARAGVEVGGAAPADPLGTLERLHHGDLYLACGCATGEPVALALFEAKFLGELDPMLRRLDRAGDLVAEVKQLLRHRLLAADPGRGAGITGYLGQGELASWLRVVATREALMWLRRHNRQRALSDRLVQELPATARSPELDYLRTAHGGAFGPAFAEAVAALTSKQRNLLRYHIVEGMNIDEIGAVYRVHRATAFRWVQKARAALTALAGEALRRRLGVSEDELKSLVRVLQSHIEVSVERVLREGSGPAGAREPI